MNLFSCSRAKPSVMPCMMNSIRGYTASAKRLKVQGSSNPPLKNDFSSYLEMVEGIEIDGVLINW